MNNLPGREREKSYKNVLPKLSEIGDVEQIKWGLGLRAVAETCVAMVKEELKTRNVRREQSKVDRSLRVD